MAIQVAAVAVLLVVVLPLYIVYKPPVFIVNQLQRRDPQVLFHIPAARNVVALTIDDAPSEYTMQILDVLQANNATATFFTIGGQVRGRENVLEAILRAGSELGNHAMHDEPSINVPTPRLREEITEVDDMISRAYEAVGQNRTMRYFRPGSGIFSDRVLDVAKQAGHRTILGSVYPHDPFIPYWRINAWHILGSLRPGAVIICHDRRAWTVPMLKKILPEMRRRGYDVVSVSELLGPTPPT
ncbi:hypothetical protein LTR09_004277 [Extremus antarcticus]|uniref:chitin deacetylase n=1 Tax=Extremus antarcticus TaxID=702011 RepID=A0AAJ0DI77_9PEZI|nr:hypothetical protein LTR09_004277 [Extremus antarcticus]